VLQYALLLSISAADLRYRRIPKHLNLLWVIVNSVLKPESVLLVAFVYLFYLSLKLIFKSGIGYGDVRFAPITAFLSVSPTQCLFTHLLSWTIAGIWVLITPRSRRSSLPFAPFLAAAVILQAR
jgi:hypothetical protein